MVILQAVLHFVATITTQPRDVTVPLGGKEVFTCFVVGLDKNINPDDVKCICGQAWGARGAIAPPPYSPLSGQCLVAKD